MSDYRLNASILHIPMPMRIKRLPISERGYPVPWFVAWIDGKADFRLVDTPKVADAIKHNKCWLCGGPLGKYKCFVIGPMCAVNRVSSEPPSHHDCAEYAVKACPFLTQPRMRRNDKDLPEDHVEPGGIMVVRNPGVTLIWTTFDYKVVGDGGGGFVLNIGEPTSVRFYAKGRKATHSEIMESIESGLPLLRAEAQKLGPKAERELAFQYARTMKLVEGCA